MDIACNTFLTIAPGIGNPTPDTETDAITGQLVAEVNP
jgi:hypothetical protein